VTGPLIPGTGRRCGGTLISAITNRGQLAFMVVTQRFTAPVFLTFLRRLLQHAPPGIRARWSTRSGGTCGGRSGRRRRSSAISLTRACAMLHP